jgi:hypothetical protein
MNQYDPMPIKIRAIRDHVIITEMSFDEIKTSAGIILRSDDGKSHGVHPRWGKVYCVGPEQKDVKLGQWILVEHGRWTRGLKIDDGDGIKTIQRVDTAAILAVSDEPPSDADFIVGNSI